MRFSIHRHDESGEESGYDSLWSDSEEEEFPVNPSDSEDDALTPEEDEADVSWGGTSQNMETSFERQYKRRSILADYSPNTSSSANHPYFRHRSSPVLTRAQLNADLENINDLIGKWSISNLGKYKQERQEEQSYAQNQWDQLYTQEQDDIADVDDTVSSITQRRRAKIQAMIEDRRLYQELLEKEQREREEAERKAKEEAERKAREEAERKAREEAERKAREEAERKAKEEAERKAKEEEARKKKEEEERKQKEEEERRAKEKAEKEGYTMWSKVDEEFKYYKDKIEDIKTNILAPVSKNSDLKKFCFNTKRHLKPKLGQLTDSKQQLKMILSEVDKILNDAKNHNDLAYKWAINFFAKAIVAQAEAEVSVKVQAALPLGTLALQVMVRHEQLVDFLLARFVKKCPHVIGFSCPIDTEEGRKRMGWKRPDGEKWEDETMYSERMAGICSVWTVINQAKLSAAHNQKHPYPISNSWRFIARHLNRDTTTLTNTDFAVVAAWWEVASDRFLQAYGKQGAKLLNLVWDNWTTSCKDKQYPAAARLRLLGEDWVNSGKPMALKPMAE